MKDTLFNMQAKGNSHTGNRTRATAVKTPDPNHQTIWDYLIVSIINHSTGCPTQIMPCAQGLLNRKMHNRQVKFLKITRYQLINHLERLYLWCYFKSLVCFNRSILILHQTTLGNILKIVHLGRLAQSVKRRADNAKVVGSSPTLTSMCFVYTLLLN